MTGLALLGAAALSGCGFTPLYGSNGVMASLSGVAVETEDQDRVDFLLEQALRDNLDSRGEAHAYTLRTRARASSTRLGVGADDVASRSSLALTVAYGLVRHSDEAVILTDAITVRASYDVPREPYAAVAAERDAENRAAREAADRIVSQLAREMRRREAR